MKKKTVSSLKNKLDRIFSLYIRLRDSRHGQNTCFTCGDILKIGLMDAGHFRRREQNSTRYDEQNVQPQCRYCNRMKGGEQHIFGLELDIKYGEGTALKLTKKSFELKKFTVPELEALCAYYQEKIRILKEG